MKTIKLNPGDRQTFQCNECSREFDLILESKLEGASKEEIKNFGAPPGEVKNCPFCGSDEVEDPHG